MKHLRIVLALALVCFVIVASMVRHVSWLQSELIKSSAIRTAQLYSIALTQFRTLYTSEVVEKARKHGLAVTHNYAARDDAIPLPATLSMMLGEQIGRLTSGASSRLYSPYPFPWRKSEENTLLDQFDKTAWEFLSVNPHKQYYQFSQEGGKAVLNYATADLMRPDCVACHNSHPDSPKTDWQAGDVRGVLEIRLPLDVITAQAGSDLHSTIIAYVIAGVGIVLLIGLVIIRLNRHREELEQRVTKRTKALHSEITQSEKMEERLRLVIEAFPVAMIMIDESGDISHANHEAETLFGYLPGDLVGSSIDRLVPDSQRSNHSRHRKSFIDNPSARPMSGRDLLARKRNGDNFPVEVGLNSIVTGDGIIVLCSVVDLTERKIYEETILDQTEILLKSNELLFHEATIDSLTNVANRRSFYSRLDTYLQLSRRNSQPVSILMADIDYFKKHNDYFGHAGGDTALKTVALTINATNREADFIARLGGDEFAILLPDTDQEGALAAAEKLRKSIENISGLERQITMSFGVATVIVNRDDQINVAQFREKFIKNADKALYYSKENGKNRVTHFNEMV